jgi:hypothetical protein
LCGFTSIIPLYYLIRKPTHILDFSLTLLFNHVFISTYSTGSFPTSLFFWVVMLTGAIIMIVGAEQVRSFLQSTFPEIDEADIIRLP